MLLLGLYAFISSPEPKAEVSYIDHVPSIVRP